MKASIHCGVDAKPAPIDQFVAIFLKQDALNVIRVIVILTAC